MNILISRFNRDIDSIKAWYNRLSLSSKIPRTNIRRNIQPNLKFFFNSFLLSSENFNSDTFFEIFGEARKQQILGDAERILSHHYRIFPNIEIFIGPHIDWHKDNISGKRYLSRYYRNIKFVNLSACIDPKIPWQLSRSHQGLRLAQAFVLSSEEKYAAAFFYLLQNWCKKNPWKFGINWTCAMEVAIRAINWIVALENIGKSLASKYLSLKFIKRVFQQHLDFILENLEWSEEGATNHYVADLLGLLAISSFLPGLKRASRAKQLAISELEKEAVNQFYEDGGNWESSTTYHRFVLEMLFLADLIAHRIGCPFSDTFRQRIKKSCLLLHSLANDDGHIPQFGDNDSGRILPFKEREDTDVRHIGSLCGLLYKDPDLIDPRWGFPEEAFWIFGEEGYGLYSSLIEKKKSVDRTSKAFKNSGWFVMRASDIQMVISAAPNGQNEKGGHCHNDKLSFTLSLGKDEVITDPGTFIYSGDIKLRRKFRSTSSHNTIMIDNEEQNRFIDKAVFWVQPDAKIRVLEWKSDERYDIFCGEHTGYERLTGQVIHRRSIGFDKFNLSLIISDEVFEKVPTGKIRELQMSLHSPLIEVEYYGPTTVEPFFDGLNRQLCLDPPSVDTILSGFRIKSSFWNLCGVFNASFIHEVLIEDCWISDSYLSKSRGRVIRFLGNANLPMRIATYLWLEKVFT